MFLHSAVFVYCKIYFKLYTEIEKTQKFIAKINPAPLYFAITIELNKEEKSLKNLKKVLAVILSLVMLVSCFGMSASALSYEEEYEYTIDELLCWYNEVLDRSFYFDSIYADCVDSYGDYFITEFTVWQDAYNNFTVENIVDFTDWDMDYDDDGWSYYYFEGYDEFGDYWSYYCAVDENNFLQNFDYTYSPVYEDDSYWCDASVEYPENAMIFNYSSLYVNYGTTDWTQVVSPNRELPEYYLGIESNGGYIYLCDDGEGYIVAEGNRDGEAYINLYDADGNYIDSCYVAVEFTTWNWICYIVFFGWIWM